MLLEIKSSCAVVLKRNSVKFNKFYGKISAMESLLSKMKPSRRELRYKGRHHWCLPVNIMQIYFFTTLFHISIPLQILWKVNILENSRKLVPETLNSCTGVLMRILQSS